VSRWLRLWFSFREPVDRRAYLQSGAALMLLKYAVDASVVWAFAGRWWTPLGYLDPVWTLRQQVLRDAPGWVAPALVVWTLPFLWIGVSLTLRRAVDAGRSPWWCLLFFVPLVNYATMLWLATQPSRPGTTGAAPSSGDARLRLRAGLMGVGAALAIAMPTVLIGVYLRRQYSAGLFLGTPFSIGYVSAYVFNARQAQSSRHTLQVAFLAVTLAGGAMLVFALEGAVCIAMALPLAALVALPGAVLGRAVVLRSVAPLPRASLGALLAPLLVLTTPRQTPPRHDVVTAIDIEAPPAVVWRRVVSFPDLAEPDEWIFRVGVAAPRRARIEGIGVGATRYCDFTTGSFIEPITAWEENRRLAFDVITQAPPMREWSPYAKVNPPHLDGYFRATQGEFRLIPLPGNRTRLEGRTRYVVDMFPQSYWTLPAGRLIAAIHWRVLRHIKAVAEEEDQP